MLILYKILTSSPARFAYLAFLVCVMFYWACAGFSWCNSQQQDKSEKTITELSAKVKAKDPVLAAELAKIQQKHQAVALAATLKERQTLEGIDGLIRLANEIKEKRAAYDLQLAGFAVNPQLVNDRIGFLTAHGNHLQQIQFVRNSTADINLQTAFDGKTKQYLNILEEAKKDLNLWQRVLDNPMYVQLLMLGIDQPLLDFYNAEKDWIDDVLFVIINSLDETETEQTFKRNAAADVKHVLETVKTSHPFFRDAVRNFLSDDTSDAETSCILLYSLFENYGQQIRLCVQNGFELGNLLSVMFANPDFCNKYKGKPTEFSAQLTKIKQEMPDVWKLAEEPFVLQLAEDVPQLANGLLRKYPDYGIAVFLEQNYSEGIPQAAAAIDKFGDLAIAILVKYSESDIFHRHLKNTELGVRIIPYCAMFEDIGLERLSQNKAWLDKYFNVHGNPKQEEWWTVLPGGSLVKAAQNTAQGLPSEWSEIGWATLDAVDAVLLVLMLGGSEVATAPVKGVLTGGKITTKTMAKITARTTGKSALRTAGTVLRSAKIPQAVHLLYQGGNIVYRTGKTATKPIQILGNGIYKTANFSVTNPFMRKALLATGLAITLYYRTLPGLKEALPQLGEKVGQLVAQSVKTGAETVASALNGFITELAGIKSGSKVLPFVVYFAVLAVFAGLVFRQGKRLLLTNAS